MKKKNIVILAIFMMLSFVALLGVQLQYFLQLLTVKEKDFDDDVQKALYHVSKSIEEDNVLDAFLVDSLLNAELLNYKIDIEFKAVLYSSDGQRVSSDQSYAIKDTLDDADICYKQSLFENNKGSQRAGECIRVWFPSKDKFILKSVAVNTIISVISTLLLFAVFIAVIVLIIRQKRLSESKSDFMHNMTHELKTPISSISLASQMLSDDSVASSDAMRHHLTSVISEETARLSFQVERVLQLSLIESDKAIMNFKPVDVNALVKDVVSKFEIKVNGSIAAYLNATQSIAEVDEMHFTNIIYNLLENAVKYAKDDVPLKLSITTFNSPNEKNRMNITVEDNGIGIAKENQSLIFEKFQRVHTGNRHDVKGFGLGLTYVKTMVLRHSGTISVDSNLGIGTKFTINIPLKQ